MSSPVREPVPTGWRAAFFVLDFLMPLGGTFGHLFAPGAILSGFTARPALPPAVETQVLLDGMAGWFAGLAGTHLWLQLYHSKDRAAWKPFIAPLILVDIGMLIGFTRALTSEGRLYNLAAWRSEDYSNLIGYALITIARIIFVMKPTTGVKKDRKAL